MTALMDAARDIWVIGRIADQSYGLPAGWVEEMMLLPTVVRLPMRAPWIRGAARCRHWQVRRPETRFMA